MSIHSFPIASEDLALSEELSLATSQTQLRVCSYLQPLLLSAHPLGICTGPVSFHEARRAPCEKLWAKVAAGRKAHVEVGALLVVAVVLTCSLLAWLLFIPC